MSTYRVVVLISGEGSNLQRMLDVQDKMNFQVVGVISSCVDALGIIRAQKRGIATYAIPHHACASRSDFDHHLKKCVDVLDPNLIVLAGFMRILTPYFVRYYAGKLMNIHPSLLPHYKGLHTHRRVLMAGEKYHGTTVHFVTEGLDEGAAIIQAKFQIRKNETEDALQQCVQQLEYQIYSLAVAWMASGRLHYDDDQVWLDGVLLPKTGYPYRV